MSDIFISYKREEQLQAKKLAIALEKKGWKVWWDPDLRAGDRVDDVIEEALKSANCIIVLWSRLSVESQYIKDEATYALKRNKLVPITIEEVDLPFRFDGIHTVRLIDWDGSDTFPEFRKLVNDITGIIGPPQNVAAEEKRKKAEAEVRRKTEVEKRRQDAEEAKRRADEEKIKKAEVEAKRKIEKEEQRKMEEEAKKKAEEEKRKADEERRRLEEEKRRAEEEEKRRSEEEAQQQAEAERRKSEEQARRKSELEARLKGEAEAQARRAEEERKRDYEVSGNHPDTEEHPGGGTSNSSNWLIGGAGVVGLIVLLFIVWPKGDTPLKSTAYEGTYSPSPVAEEPPASPPDNMVFVKGGCFQMGDTFGDGYATEKPVHEVCVDDFYMGKYEVTQEQWQNVMDSNPSNFTGCDNCPVERVSWNDVQEYINKLNENSGKSYRLPTEAEWEYAARERGKKVRFGTGKDTIGSDEANFKASAQYKEPYSQGGEYRRKTTPVGSFKPNSLGFYDMSGNVVEFVQDWYGEEYYKVSPRNNPQGPLSGEHRVQRGGSWAYVPGAQRAAFRSKVKPFNWSYLYGFRLSLSAQE